MRHKYPRCLPLQMHLKTIDRLGLAISDNFIGGSLVLYLTYLVHSQVHSEDG